MFRVEAVGKTWRVFHVGEFQGTTYTKTIAIFSDLKGEWMMHINTDGMWWSLETCREVTALFEELKMFNHLEPRTGETDGS